MILYDDEGWGVVKPRHAPGSFMLNPFVDMYVVLASINLLIWMLC